MHSEEETNSNEVKKEEKLKAKIVESMEETQSEKEKEDDNTNQKDVKEEIKSEEISKQNIEVNQKSNKKILKSAIIVIISLLIIGVLLTGFALLNMNNSGIISGITIRNVNVEGLDKEKAKEKVLNQIQQEKEINLKIEGVAYTIGQAQIEVKYNIDNALDEAYNLGRSKNILVNNFEIAKILFKKRNIDIEVNYNEELLNNIITEINAKIPNAVIDSGYYIENEKLIITKGKLGQSIDTEYAKQCIKNILNTGKYEEITLNTKEVNPEEIDIDKIHQEVYKEPKDAYFTKEPFQIFTHIDGVDFDIEKAKEVLKEDKEEYEIELIITRPKVTINDIGTEAFPNLLSSFTTKYNATLTSRTNNLKLASNKINGTVVMPGETFSYNRTVGKRTVEAGYKDAAGYEGGKVVDMLGGGICQISSTLYDAVVYANLDIVERHNHMFTTSYVGAGKDATVSYGALDFKFKNTRSNPIMIKSSVNSGVAKVEIFGIKEEVEYEVEIVSTILGSIPFKVIYEDTTDLEPGVEKVAQGGMSGCNSITYKILKLNGVQQSKTVLSRDKYSAMNKIIRRGKQISSEPAVQTSQPVEETTVIPQEPEMPAPVIPINPATSG